MGNHVIFAMIHCTEKKYYFCNGALFVSVLETSPLSHETLSRPLFARSHDIVMSYHSNEKFLLLENSSSKKLSDKCQGIHDRV